MSADILNPFSSFQVVVRKGKLGKKVAAPRDALRHRVVAALFTTAPAENIPPLLFQEIIVVSPSSEQSSSSSDCNNKFLKELESEDPNPATDPDSAVETNISALSSYEETENIEGDIYDDDFVYFGSRDFEDEDDYSDLLWEACHDMADEYEATLFMGRSKSRRSLNSTLRAKSANKQEKVNPKRRIKVCEAAKKEACESNISHYNAIRKAKSSRKYSHMIPVPPWVVQEPYSVAVPAANRGHVVLNPNSRVEEERQLALALQASQQEVHASGLSMRQILELTTRELTPEDFDMLLLLDSQVQKKTLSKKDVKKFKQCCLTCDGPADEPCVVCFSPYLKGENQTELPCSHKYHTTCIETWLTESGTTCPLCGVSLD